MDFKSKPTAPATVSADGATTLATKGYVDAAIPSLSPMGAYHETLVTLGATSGAINLNNGNVFQITPSTTITFAISNAKAGAHSFTLIVHQGATARALTWPASIKWVGGEVPDVSETNKSYLFTFATVNSGSKWFGIFAGSVD